MENQEDQLVLLKEVMEDVRKFAIERAEKKELNPTGLASGFLFSIRHLIGPNIGMLMNRDDPKSAVTYLKGFKIALTEEIKNIDKMMKSIEKTITSDTPEASSNIHLFKIHGRKNGKS